MLTRARTEFLSGLYPSVQTGGGNGLSLTSRTSFHELLSVFMTGFVNRAAKNKSCTVQTTGEPFCFRFEDLLYLSNRQKRGRRL